MAIEDNWQRFAVVPDFAHMSGDSRFRLVFGQEDVSSCIASRSAMWVHVIEVMLGGTPPAGVTLDQETLNLKVGSTFRLQATIEPFEATDKSVTWSSSDISVATVDDSGLVSVVGPGNAVITVSTVVGNMSASCSVNDPGEVVATEVVETGAEADENEAQEQNLSAGGTVAGPGFLCRSPAGSPGVYTRCRLMLFPCRYRRKKTSWMFPLLCYLYFYCCMDRDENTINTRRR
ncbi:MAG: Ig-like domain-containing protein [Candidatus Syntrophopropionicum ammoniitolerans]